MSPWLRLRGVFPESTRARPDTAPSTARSTPTACSAPASTTPRPSPADVRNWLREQAFEAHEHDGHDHDHHDHDHHDHDHGSHRHDERFTSFCVRREGACSWNCWVEFLEALLTSHGESLLRLKGILNVTGLETPVAVHGVQHMFHPPAILEAWPSDDRTSRIVFIGDGLPQAGVEKMLDAWIEADREANP